MGQVFLSHKSRLLRSSNWFLLKVPALPIQSRGPFWKLVVQRGVFSPVLVQIAFFLEKENNPPNREPTKEDLFKTPSIPVTPTTTPTSCALNGEASFKEGELDARDLEMSKKVRRSYSRLEALDSASTSTPGRHSYFGFGGPEDLSGVSPVVCSNVIGAPAKPWAPDTTLPGISPPVLKEKQKKKKLPEILKSELDEWAAALNAEFEAAEQFDLLIE